LKKEKNNQPAIISDQDKQEKKGKLVTATQEFAGPIPHPEIFRQYGLVVPDAPERILKVFELDSQHTRDMQKNILAAEVRRDLRAQWMSYSILLVSLGIMAYSVRYGNVVSGFSGLATLILALRALFFKKSN